LGRDPRFKINSGVGVRVYFFRGTQMTFKLSKSIQVGQKIHTGAGWAVVTEVTEEGAVTKHGLIKFGDTVYGWKAN
jgi:preprotein translocase subunit YajC